MFTLQAIYDWVDAPGTLISWNPSMASLAKADAAPASDVPASHQQANHLRNYRQHTANGTEMARLIVAAWTMDGRCDTRAMTHVINTYLRRHDTFRSWFEFTADDRIVRRTFANRDDIKFVAARHGEMTSREWQGHILATPGPLQWDCFRFGLIQRDDHFTFYMSVDHIHVDAMFITVILNEIHLMYSALAKGAAPISLPEVASYGDYCVRQHAYISALTPQSPEVRRWIRFAEANRGGFPLFPLPLGDQLVPEAGRLLVTELMNEEQTNRFEYACTDAGARFSGGVFACAALAEHKLTGAETYHVITPTTTRSTPAEYATTGWFAAAVPVTVPVVATSFADTARAAQASFDSSAALANVPFERVLELADPQLRLSTPAPGVSMLSYIDATHPPITPAIVSQWHGSNGRIYSNLGAANQVGIWVNRFGDGTKVTVAFANNPVARESVAQYVETMKSVCARVAEGRPATARFSGAGSRR